MLLNVQGLSIEFQTELLALKVVTEVSFSIELGKTLALVGESGCGKSVTALSLTRLLPTPPANISSGVIDFQGEDLRTASLARIRQIRGKEIGMIFQEPMTSLNPVFTAGFQITEAIINHNPKESKKAAKSFALELLKAVGISDPNRCFDSYPHELSGGMRQRVMIAMALSCNPKLLIADEPTTALDVTIQAQILELISDLQIQRNLTVLLITHDLAVVAENAHHVSVMYAGQIVENTSVEEIFNNPLHPYTRGLLASIPKLNREHNKELSSIPGFVPNMGALPAGCRFQDRCSIVTPNCRKSEPVLEEKRNSHWVRCFEVHREAIH